MGVAHPAEAVAAVEGFAGFQGRLRFPEEDDVVAGFVGGGEFDEVEFSLIEAFEGFDADAGAVVVASFGVEVGGEGAVALEEGPRAGFIEGEDAVAGAVFGLFEGAEVEGAVGEFHEDAVAVVDFGAEVVGFGVGGFAEPEHAGEGREAELGDGLAEGELGFDVDDGFGAWGDGELEGSGDAGAVEEGP